MVARRVVGTTTDVVVIREERNVTRVDDPDGIVERNGRNEDIAGVDRHQLIACFRIVDAELADGANERKRTRRNALTNQVGITRVRNPQLDAALDRAVSDIV